MTTAAGKEGVILLSGSTHNMEAISCAQTVVHASEKPPLVIPLSNVGSWG